MNMKKTNTLKGVNSMPAGTRIVTYICLAWALIVSLLPIGWLVLSSLKKDPMARPGFQLPESICLDGYISTFKDLHVMRYFGNSLFVAGVSVVISVVMISMSAYVVARMEFKGKALVNVLLYSTMFIPATALTYPVYNLVNRLHLYDTRSALEEAARIDGCGYVQTWMKVIFPIARPGIMTAAVLAFLNNWNEYYWASLVLITREKLTVPALLSTFTTAFNTNYNGLFSAMVIIILPPVLLYCIFSRFFIEALSGGAVKG